MNTAGESSTPGRQPARRVDASMDLLREITETAVDPGYRYVPPGSGRRAERWLILPVVTVAVAMFSMSAIATTRSAPDLERNRQELIIGINDERAHQDDLRAEKAELERQVNALEEQVLAHDVGRAAVEGEFADLAVASAAQPATGPGLTIVVDDAPGDTLEDRVIDTDLQQLVNGLWASGAEAISINGHRLTSLTAIRGAGEAITVDYRSLTRPYTVEVIGDPASLEQNFAQTDGGVWWNYLESTLGMSMTISQASQLELPAASRTTLRHAEGEPG